MDEVPTAYSREQAEVYDRKRFVDPPGVLIHERESSLLMDAASGLVPGSRVLEVGCGTGRLLMELAERGLELYGTDASSDMLRELEAKLTLSGVKVELDRSEAAKLPYESNYFDFVYSIRMLNQTESPDYAMRAIAEMLRVAQPGGYVLVEYVNKYRPRRSAQTTRLSFSEISHLAALTEANVVWAKGAFFLGMTSYYRSPRVALKPLARLDDGLSSLAPKLAARCYVLLRKGD